MAETPILSDSITTEHLANGHLAFTVAAGGHKVRKVTARNYPNVIVRWYLANPYDRATGAYDRTRLELVVNVVKATSDPKVAERTFQRMLVTHVDAGVAWLRPMRSADSPCHVTVLRPMRPR